MKTGIKQTAADQDGKVIRQTVTLAPVMGPKFDSYIASQRELGRRVTRNDVVTEALIAFFRAQESACIHARAKG